VVKIGEKRMRLSAKWAWLSALLLFSSNAFAEHAYNMPVGVTPISRDIYELHMAVFWMCVGIGVVVFGIMFYALIMHRKSRGHKAAQFHEHTMVEILWAVVPFFLLVAMAVPATIVLMRMQDVGDADLTVKVVGYQWRWQYEYLDQGISFFSNLSTTQDQIHNLAKKSPDYLLEVDKPLVLPINKKVRFLVTANDVIHSWWVPALGVKQDAIPGFIHETWTTITTPGTYRGQCAELCGINHGFMPIVVVAKTQDEFNEWVKQQTGGKVAAGVAAITKKWTKDELMQKGEVVYNTTCAACHKVDGTGMPPTFPPMKGDKVATGPVAAHMSAVLKGKPGTAMQAFGPQLNDEDLAAVITYERNAFGNNTNTIVQPSEVKAARGK
jgi:cytochrome c oxidase subunit 2